MNSISNCTLAKICESHIRAIEYRGMLIVLKHNQGISINTPQLAIIWEQKGDDLRKVRELQNFTKLHTLKQTNRIFRRGWWTRGKNGHLPEGKDKE